MNIHKIEDISELARPTAVTVGMFDGVHVGHQHILSLLKAEAAREVLTPVVVTFDQHPRQVLGGGVGGVELNQYYRVTTNEERYGLLEHYGIGDVVELHFTPKVAALSACQFFEQLLVERLKARVLVLGYDNMFGSRSHNDFDRLAEVASSHGVRVAVDSAVSLRGVAVSSTQIRRALKEGQVEAATDFLGYNYRLWGEVVKGRQMGRRMGFPTANVCLDDTTKVMPADGVYAVRVTLEGGGAPLMGMANMGGQPTFGLKKPVFEVHIFDFDGDLYGSVLRVEFVARLREVRRFDSVEALVGQLTADRIEARRRLEEMCGGEAAAHSTKGGSR